MRAALARRLANLRFEWTMLIQEAQEDECRDGDDLRSWSSVPRHRKLIAYAWAVLDVLAPQPVLHAWWTLLEWWCERFGCRMDEYESWCTPDTGGESVGCSRCGRWSTHVFY